MTIRKIIEGQAGLPVPNSTKSYWHQSPSQRLFGHRTTSELPATADIVIVGTGITGSFAAHFMKTGKAKHERVLMLEAREACWGATGRNGGHCQPMLYASAPEVAAFELGTYNFLKSFVAANNIPCDWRSIPGVHACLSPDVWDQATAAVARLQEVSPDLAAQCEVVGPCSPSGDDSTALAQGRSTLDSLLIPHANGAIVQQNAASLWPYKLVSWVLENLLEKFPAPSFNLQTNTPVTALVRDADGAWLLRTPRGPVKAKTVLLCTNGYTSRLLPEFRDLIVPVRGQVAALIPPPADGGDPVRLTHTYVTLGRTPGEEQPQNEYLVQRPLPNGEHILGGGRNASSEKTWGVWNDDVIEEPISKWLKTHLTPHVGEEKELKASFEWTGIMGYSRDHHAYIGAVPESLGGGGPDGGLWVCAGYSGHGMPAAPLSAQAVVRLMTGDSITALEGGVALPRQFMLTEDRVKVARRTFETLHQRESHPFTPLASDLSCLRTREKSDKAALDLD